MPEQLSKRVAKVRIHPAIGIARLGNHPDEYFIGPEVPGQSVRPLNGFKTAGMVKRQAARFRIFAYDKNDKLLGEVSSKAARISWTVELANKKSEWKLFDGLNESDFRRNEHVKQSQQRKRLIIGPEKHSLTGPDKSVAFDNGSFTAFREPQQTSVQRPRSLEARTVDNILLGEMLTDSSGRLVVLGGYGESGAPFGERADRYANNPGWYDDIADGPVDARIRFHDTGESFTAEGAWVVTAPPDFAPEVGNIVSMYDVLYDKAINEGVLSRPAKPLFYRDIYPILKRSADIIWVHEVTGRHAVLVSALKPDAPDSLRQLIFNHLRTPQGGGGNMPKLFKEIDAEYRAGLSLTPTQYHFARQWKDGDFVVDEKGGDEEVTPEGLDKAALDACVGGGLFPGIEMSWFVRDTYRFSGFLRLAREQPGLLPTQRLTAGDVTKQMAVPWQADFAKCGKERDLDGDGVYGWWPAIRPDDVLPETGFRIEPWARGVNLDGDHKEMAGKWFRLGFVVKVGEEYRETERNDKPLQF